MIRDGRKLLKWSNLWQIQHSSNLLTKIKRKPSFEHSLTRFTYLCLLYMKHVYSRDSIREHSPSGWWDSIAKKKQWKRKEKKKCEESRSKKRKLREDLLGPFRMQGYMGSGSPFVFSLPQLDRKLNFNVRASRTKAATLKLRNIGSVYTYLRWTRYWD